MFNPAKAAEQIKKEYISYISTTFHFRNQEIQKKFVNELEKTVSKGPFIEIKDTFITGKSIQDMITQNILSPLFNDLEKIKNEHYPRKLPVTRPLYLHQEKAIEKIVAGKNVVVSTGTGSGKTNCFLIPVINELLLEQERNKLDDGVRAIFIYPMNALANDQIKGLREILMDYPAITFGVYNGNTEHEESDAIKLYNAMYANEKYPKLRKRLPNELIARNEMKKKPPHILFTNYAMLEHMLLRPSDDTIFSRSNFKFIVLDEAHVYTGATGIETALLMGRLKGRLGGEKHPQFILTSATLGDGSVESNEKIVNFARNITGCDFYQEDIITAYRNKNKKYPSITSYPQNVYIDLANDEFFFRDTLLSNNIQYDSKADDKQILYDLIIQTDMYSNMRSLDSLITFDDFIKKLNISRETAVSFVSLCAKAQKDGKPLVDIRYHYFLRALDGGFLALDYPESFSLTRREDYKETSKMFEIAVCDDCGEIAIVAKQENGKLNRTIIGEDTEYYQIISENINDIFEEEDEIEQDELSNKNKAIEKYILCKTCGSIVLNDEAHNNWCNCSNKDTIQLIKLPSDECKRCNSRRPLRRIILGYEAATGVVATSLFEQIPEHTYEENIIDESHEKNIFAKSKERKKRKILTAGQFLIFSDSRQGAAKFACFLEDSYKEFLRRRGIWNVIQDEGNRSSEGVPVNDFVDWLDCYFSTHKLFRNSNADNAQNSIAENRRNAWVAVLNELFNSNRDTSLVSLGKISFDYRGNTEEMIDIVVDKYRVKKDDAKSFLNYLAFEIIRAGAIMTDKDTDINDSDRKYIFYTQAQKVVTKNRDPLLRFSEPFLPTNRQNNNGERTFYRSNKLLLTKNFLKIDNNKAVEFLGNYWDGVLVSEDNPHRLQTRDGKGFYMLASSFNMFFGNSAILWKCDKCQKVTQFNIGSKCIKLNCNGTLKRLNSDDFCKENHYAMLYESRKLSPLFVKEHTAQLAKKDALDYQQLFIRKEINALSCSTTFELGVDLGDLETVFLRNIPPLASNYAQRVGRAGRGINAAAFALTFARLSSHDFTFFEHPEEMINGIISPPQFKLENEKIIKRHIYAVALSLFLKNNPDLYGGNNANKFINEKGYTEFLEWIKSKPESLDILLKNSIPKELWQVPNVDLGTFGWLEDFCGEKGKFTKLIAEYENNIDYLKKEKNKAHKEENLTIENIFDRKLKQYQKNELIDFLVRGNILPKYGFPVDSVELSQNITSPNFKSLNLNRDLSIAISEYAPSAEVVADGRLYTSRYIRKPIVNKNESSNFEISYIAECPKCRNINYRNIPVNNDGQPCAICGNKLTYRDFYKSIEPRAGFIAEKDVQPVPLSSQERKYKTEAIYIGDKNAYPVDNFEFAFGKTKIKVESTINDSLVIKSTDFFYVCSKCGYTIASDEKDKLKRYNGYDYGVNSINNGPPHDNPFGGGRCENTELYRYWLHHEFKTDVAKLTFETDTSDSATMLSVMYALLNSFTNTLSIEKRDMKACLTYKKESGKFEHKIIIYDDVPGGAGHSRRLVTQDGTILQQVIEYAIRLLSECDCEPSCYKCLRNYENQKIHEILNRKKALVFLQKLNINALPPFIKKSSNIKGVVNER